ncbi:hypothetical protein AM500_19080 [Bacillus sp. FJAT-18017]|uniref:hypothetical protein n=1 Tax=Bacillus sp. FJAT-18017 TaxID=1705566 RepID=UPI0006AEF51B|nr:hypothetical protein [Bacillus sp. FJAT-18017]ALC91653.1 hypothetical protein AM500_19080 [Bacillus sp. FJAT-18017]
MNIEEEFLKAQLEKFSEYRSEFIAETRHEDILMSILRVHMYIEKEMVELTKIYFKYPNKFNDYTFKSRLDLLYALGVIERELYDPIQSINNVRNKLSHNLDFKFTENIYKKIYDSLSKEILTEFKKDLEVYSWLNKNPNFIEKTKILLACIWTNIKASVLTSFINKRELAKELEMQALDDLIEFEKSRK